MFNDILIIPGNSNVNDSG